MDDTLWHSIPHRRSTDDLINFVQSSLPYRLHDLLFLISVLFAKYALIGDKQFAFFFLSPAPPVCVCGKQKKFHLCTLYLWILFVISTVLLCEQSELIRARGVSVCDVRVLRAFHFSSKMTTVCASHLCDTIRFFFSSKNSIVELRHRDYLALTSVVCFCCCRCFVRAKFSRHFARVMSWSKIQLECNKFSWQWNKFAASRRATPRIPCEWANEWQDGRTNEATIQYFFEMCICATSWIYRRRRDRLRHMPATDVKQIIWHENRNWLLLSRLGGAYRHTAYLLYIVLFINIEWSDQCISLNTPRNSESVSHSIIY